LYAVFTLRSIHFIFANPQDAFQFVRIFESRFSGFEIYYLYHDAPASIATHHTILNFD